MDAMADPNKYPTRIAPYGLRMPPELKQRVESSAKANGRTLHAEIITALEYLYPAPTPLDDFKHEIGQAFHDFFSADTEQESLVAVGDLQMLMGQKLEEAIQGEVQKRLEERQTPANPADRKTKEVKDSDIPF